MIARDINPFIRRAFILKKTPLNKSVVNSDCRLFYVISGSGTLTVENKVFSFENDFFALWKSETEYCWNFSKTNNIQLAIINFDYTQDFSHITEPLGLIPPEDASEQAIIRCEAFSDICQLNSPVCIKNFQIYKEGVLSIINTFMSASVFSKELSDALLKKLIFNVVRYITAGSIYDSVLLPVLDYIHANYNREITNSALGKLINYHPYHVNLLMKKYTGRTLHSYITQIRMNEASRLLANTNSSIESISTETGYKNPSHFYKVFKQHFGISPSEYRRHSALI